MGPHLPDRIECFMKNKQILLHFALLIALALAFQNCRKDNGPSKKDALAGAPWLIIENLSDPDHDGQFTDILDDCQKDDTWTFGADGFVGIQENAVLCDPDFPADYSVRWELRERETILVWLFGSDELRYRIIDFDETSMVLYALDDNKQGSPVYEKITLKR